MREKKRFVIPIVAGFIVLYLVIMQSATLLVKQKFQEDYQGNFERLSSSLQSVLMDAAEDVYIEEDAAWRGYANRVLSMVATSNINDGKQQFSAALYDPKGALLLESQAVIGITGSYMETEGDADGRMLMKECYYALSDYLTEEEKEELAGYVFQTMQNHFKYRFLLLLSGDGREPYAMTVQEVEWVKGNDSIVDPLTGSSHEIQIDDEIYGERSSRIVWSWKTDRTDVEKPHYYDYYQTTPQFPYLINGIEEWKRWEDSEYLHSFSDTLDKEEGYYTLEEYINAFFYNTKQVKAFPDRIKRSVPIYLSEKSSEAYTLILASEARPWQAAMGYMRHVYLAGFLLMLVCMGKILYATSKTYDQRAALEETRRDFTNAMAHELKTPLGIIRGFAENLKEHTVEEKRDYYLDQIIGQTEEMDRLVAEMIYVSRLDAGHLVLQKERISMEELFREQMEKFQPVTEEKRLAVSYDCGEAFWVEGDRDYLEKAVWNLISNAVAYNVPDGSIRIHTEKDGCFIENTGFPLEEELLAHAFDMFYSGDKSRGSREKHMGLGLFLVKKILSLHHLDVHLENTESGVRAVIRR